MVDAIVEQVRAICRFIRVLESTEKVARCCALIILKQSRVNRVEITVKKLDRNRTTVYLGQRRNQVLCLPGLLHTWLVQHINRINEWTRL